MKAKDGGTVLVTSRTKGREAVSHFSCAWTSFPTGRKHEDKALSQKKMTYINSWSEPKQTTLFPKCPNVSKMHNAVWIIKNTSAYKTSGNVSVDYFQADSDSGVALSFKPTLNTINQQSELLIMTGHLITTVKDCVLMLYLVSAHNCLQGWTVMSQVWNVSNNLWFQSKL